MKITLPRGFTAIVDDEDYVRVVAAGPWRATVQEGCTVYVIRHVGKPDGTRTTQKLHRFILGITDPKVFVDHRNRKGLDNRKLNLRVCSYSQNATNAKKKGSWKSTSQFRGVSWNKQNKRWHSQIHINGKQIYLGTFTDELEAARAYDVAARKHFGEFARTNIQEKTL